MAGGKGLDAKKKKIVEDKTFGLKNKNKSARVAKYVETVEKTVAGGQDKRAKALERERERQRNEKAAAEAHSALIADVSKVVIAQPKVSRGGDSKSLVCEYFKRGLCTKGTKCKFSHDLALERKSEKRSLYEEAPAAGSEGDMSTWTEEQLREAVDKKHGATNRTSKICKFFLEALETHKYGWFWQCPNGDTCIYRHALPQGYVLRSIASKQEAEDDEDRLPLEEIIEQERARLTGVGTPVTLETFLAWKERKRAEREQASMSNREEKARNFAQGRKHGLTGRDLFEFDPSMFADDDAADDMDVYERAAGEADDDDDVLDNRRAQSDSDENDNGEGPAGDDGDVQVDGALFAAEAEGLDDDSDEADA